MENKITYAEIDEWARSWGNKGYYYKKIHPTYKILGVSINKYGEKVLFLNNPSYDWIVRKIGSLNGYNSKELLTDFVNEMKKQDCWEGKYIQYGDYFKDYGFPIDAFAPNDEEKPFSTPVEAKPSVDNSDMPPFETVIAHNDEESRPQIETAEPEVKEEEKVEVKDKDDHTCIDYNSFVFAKNGYIREKVNSFLFKYKVGVIALYTIIAIIISTSFFKSQYFLEASFVMRLFWIFVFIGVSVWLGKLADKKLSEMFDKFKKEEENSFSLTDEVVYNKVLDKMVNNEIDYLSHNTKRTLTRLLEKQSPDIPQEVYELKRSCDVSSATFVDAIAPANRKALLKEILDKQANFARKKSIDLLNKVKEGGAEALAKEVITPLGRVDAAVRDILQKNNLVEEKDK